MNVKSHAVEHDPWDTGELGRSEDHVGVVGDAECRTIDASLSLHPVSIRLEKSLIANLKAIAGYRGVAYQPLVRDLLNRFVVSELKDIAAEVEAKQNKRKDGEEVPAVANYFKRERKRA